MSSLARLEYLVTPAYATDTVTERKLRWVKITEDLNSEYLLKDDKKEDTMSL